MTVQELINKLNEVNNKESEVFLSIPEGMCKVRDAQIYRINKDDCIVLYSKPFVN